MSFFDDKQEILKVELTTYGRFLISRGKFKPAYYAFFDDDVLYDGDYANIEETQNSTQTRILDETPSLKPQTTFTSIENSVKLNTLLPSETGKLKQEESQISADKNYALSLPLANSSISSEYAPSWAFQILNGKISYVSGTVSGSFDSLQPYLRYPQIYLQDNIYDIKKSVNNSETEEGYNTISLYAANDDEYYYSMKDSPIIIDLKEENVDDLKNNFDIEIFVEEQETIVGTDEKKNTWKQLNFKKEPVAILNDILLDEPMTFDIQEDENFAEYFFEMTVDDEIELPPQQKSIGGLPYRSLPPKPPFGVDC